MFVGRDGTTVSLIILAEPLCGVSLSPLLFTVAKGLINPWFPKSLPFVVAAVVREPLDVTFATRFYVLISF